MTRLRAAATALACVCLAVDRRRRRSPKPRRSVDRTRAARAPVRPVKSGVAVYIVKLKAPGAASYQRESSGVGSYQAAKRPAAVRPGSRRLRATRANSSRPTTGCSRRSALRQQGLQLALRAERLRGEARSGAGVAARPAERGRAHLARLRAEVRTNNSAIFLGLENQVGGLRADLKLRGENVVVGVIDSGIAPNHPSLADTEDRTPRACRSEWARSSWLGVLLCTSYRRNPPTELVYDPPVGFRGVCQTGDGFDPTACNNKIVGARFYVDGFLFRHDLDPRRIPLAAGRRRARHAHRDDRSRATRVGAQLFGTRVARIAGIAPRARIAVYKACWLKPGDLRATCATSDLARAIDDAVADGVDIINYSLGSLETDLTEPDDLALLNAFDAGVLSVVAAGNDGPELDTIGSPSSAPWVLTVGGFDADRQAVRRGDRDHGAADARAAQVPMREASFTPQLSSDEPIEESLVEVDDGQSRATAARHADACQPLVNEIDVDGRIALIERGGCEFRVKLDERGAGRRDRGRRLQHQRRSPIVMNGDVDTVGIPAVMIGTADGEAAARRARRRRGRASRAREAALLVRCPRTATQMADFSSRGPALSDQNFLKPDVTAPGRRHPRGHDARRAEQRACRARRFNTCRAPRNRLRRSPASRRCSRRRIRTGRPAR